MTVAALCGFLPAILSAQGLTKATLEIGPSRHAWTGSAVGPMIANRGQRACPRRSCRAGCCRSRLASSRAVRWRYSFTRVPPPDLQAYLCNADRCVMLPGRRGQDQRLRWRRCQQGLRIRLPRAGKTAVWRSSLQGAATKRRSASANRQRRVYICRHVCIASPRRVVRDGHHLRPSRDFRLQELRELGGAIPHRYQTFPLQRRA